MIKIQFKKVLVAAALLLATNAQAQVIEEDVIFSIDASLTDSTITLTSLYGCEWKTITLPRSKEQIVVSSAAVGLVKDGPPEAEFVFLLNYEKDKVKLISLKGAKWTMQTLPCKNAKCTFTITDAAPKE